MSKKYVFALDKDTALNLLKHLQDDYDNAQRKLTILEIDLNHGIFVSLDLLSEVQIQLQEREKRLKDFYQDFLEQDGKAE